MLAHRRDFAEHLASADLPTAASGRVVAADTVQVAGAWVLVDSYAAEIARVTAEAGAVGLLVPSGVDEAGWMPKMIAGPVPAALLVLSVRTDLHASMAAAAATVVSVTA